MFRDDFHPGSSVTGFINNASTTPSIVASACPCDKCLMSAVCKYSESCRELYEKHIAKTCEDSPFALTVTCKHYLSEAVTYVGGTRSIDSVFTTAGSPSMKNTPYGQNVE